MSKPVVILDHFREPLWESTDKRFIVCQGGAGSGKAVSLDTKVVTPTGPIEIKDVRIGDMVCDTEGGACFVLNKWECNRRMYDLTLEDGRYADVADNHQWTFYFNGVKRDGTTLDLISKMNEGEVYLPLSKPVYYKGTFKYADVESLAYILTRYYVDASELPVDVSKLKKSKLMKDSGKLVRNVPKEYMSLIVSDRIQLIHSLYNMSAKKYDSNTQEILLTFKVKSIAEKIQQIIWSLGGRCSCRNSLKEGGFTLRFDFDDYELKEKITGIAQGYPIDGYIRRYNPEGVRIKSMKMTSDKPCQCIEVSSSNHLYLINDFICTHNSEAICQRLCYMFLTMEDTVFAVVRSTMPALTRSVYLGDPSIVKTLKDWGVPVEKWLNKTEYTIRNPLNGSVIYFIGLDDPEKIKSMNLNYIFIEEATEINADKWAQLNARLRRHNKYSKNQMFIAYNPISWYNWVVQMFVANPDENIKNDTLVHFSNFTQNPYVSIDNVKSMLARASQDESFYRTYIIGKPGRPLGLIYPNITFTPHTTWPEGVMDVKPYYGIDWGFIDPMVLVECRDFEDKIYVICRFYKTKTNTKEFLKYMEDNKISKVSNIYYDSADAERGSLLLQAGFTGFKAKKNINAGISYVKGFEIIVDSMGPFGEDAMNEIQAYTWQTDPDDSSKFIEKPIEINNHFCLIGETILNTENGRVMLKDVKVGDKVLSHLGYREVTDKCLTKKDAELFTLTLTNGYKLQGTGDHRVVTRDGPKEIQDLKPEDNVFIHAGTKNGFVAIMVEESVKSVEPSGFGDVYSITVDEAHTYFANDILVKNCDALRYAVVTEHMYNRNFATASLDLSIEDKLRKGGIYFGDEKS